MRLVGCRWAHRVILGSLTWFLTLRMVVIPKKFRFNDREITAHEVSEGGKPRSDEYVRRQVYNFMCTPQS